MKNKLIKLTTIKDDKEFYAGTIFRHYFSNNDFYDYLLTLMLWEREFMILVNISSDCHKRGGVYGGVVSIDDSSGKFVVTKKQLSKTLNLDEWFLVEKC